MSKYLDLDGLQYNVQKTKEYISNQLSNYNNNLLLDTNQGSVGWGYWAPSASVLLANDNTYNGSDGVYVENVNIVTDENVILRYKLNPEKIVSGKTYRLSFSIKQIADSNLTGAEDDKRITISIKKPTGADSLITPVAVHTTQKTIMDEWVNMSVDLTASTSGVSEGGQVIYIVIPPGAWFGLSIKDLMLIEIGSESIWRRANEDLYVGLQKGVITGTTMALQPNKYYKWGSISSALTVTFAEEGNSNILNEYVFEFTAERGCSLSMPSTVKWLNGETPIIESGKTYQISVTNNLAICAQFS